MFSFRPRPFPVLAAFLLAGCAATQPVQIEWRGMQLLDIEAPAAGKKGQPVSLTITARKLDGCWEGATGGATVDEATKTVTVIVTERRVAPDPCTQAITYPTATATFTPASAGTYTVKATVLAGRETNDKKELAKAIAVSE